MARKIKNGDKYGEWTVIKAYSSKSPRYKSLCRCSCGVEREVMNQNLVNGTSVSCGHGRYETRLQKAKDRRLSRIGKENFEDKLVNGSSYYRIFEGKSKNNKSGVKGIQKTENGKYTAFIAIKSEMKYLGTFDTIEEAEAARKAAEEKYYKPILKEYQDKFDEEILKEVDDLYKTYTDDDDLENDIYDF